MAVMVGGASPAEPRIDPRTSWTCALERVVNISLAKEGEVENKKNKIRRENEQDGRKKIGEHGKREKGERRGTK